MAVAVWGGDGDSAADVVAGDFFDVGAVGARGHEGRKGARRMRLIGHVRWKAGRLLRWSLLPGVAVILTHYAAWQPEPTSGKAGGAQGGKLYCARGLGAV